MVTYNFNSDLHWVGILICSLSTFVTTYFICDKRDSVKLLLIFFNLKFIENILEMLTYITRENKLVFLDLNLIVQMTFHPYSLQLYQYTSGTFLASLLSISSFLGN